MHQPAMEGGGASMDVWEEDWEVLPEPDRRIILPTESSAAAHGHGGKIVGDQETEDPNLPPSKDGDGDAADARKTVDGDDECNDIGVDVPSETRSIQDDLMATATDLLVHSSDEHEAFGSSDAKEVDGDKEVVAAPADRLAGEEEEVKKERATRPPECVVFSLGKLRVNGIGALCSFGVAAATLCVFLIGGRLQHHQRRQQQQKKIQLQFYGDDKRMQQVVQQTSRLNQAMSSVLGGSASARANISFGGFYDGF